MTFSDQDIQQLATALAPALRKELAPNIGGVSLEKVCNDHGWTRRHVLDLVRAGKITSDGPGKNQQIEVESLKRYLNRNKKPLPKVK